MAGVIDTNLCDLRELRSSISCQTCEKRVRENLPKIHAPVRTRCGLQVEEALARDEIAICSTHALRGATERRIQP
jgi:hypothetical protein